MTTVKVKKKKLFEGTKCVIADFKSLLSNKFM